MWSRSELKARAKAAFKANYWKCVLAALILSVLVGGGAGSGVRTQQKEDAAVAQQQAAEASSKLDLDGSSLIGDVLKSMERVSNTQKSRITLSLGGGLVGVALSLLVFNPLIVGCYRFFLQNRRGLGDLKDLGAGFKENWGNVVLGMFLRNLFIALWSLLFIIPGIVKALSYQMVPYILKEHPELTGMQAITISRKMMNGHKWRAFVLDLSFLGWLILSALTCGILHIFWVGPYIEATNAELYEAVRAEFEARPQA